MAESTVIFLPVYSRDAITVTTSFSNSSDLTKNNVTSECNMLANQLIVFADLHIIQAVRNLIDWNKTGAINELNLGGQQLEEALAQQFC